MNGVERQVLHRAIAISGNCALDEHHLDGALTVRCEEPDQIFMVGQRGLPEVHYRACLNAECHAQAVSNTSIYAVGTGATRGR